MMALLSMSTVILGSFLFQIFNGDYNWNIAVNNSYFGCVAIFVHHYITLKYLA